jgi:hypothetical protein
MKMMDFVVDGPSLKQWMIDQVLEYLMEQRMHLQ